MSERVDGLVESIEEQVGKIRTHAPAVSEAAEENGNALVQESCTLLEQCLSSIESAVSEKRLATLPAPALTQLVKLTSGVADVAANMVGNFDGHAGNFTNQVDSLHLRLWNDRTIDPEAEVATHRAAVGQLDAAIEAARTHIAELEKGLEHLDRVKVASDEADRLKTAIQELVAETKSRKQEVDEFATEAESVHGTFSTKSTDINNLLEQARASKTNVGALEADLKKWHGEIDKARNSIEQARDSTEAKLNAYDDEIGERKRTLDEIEKKIEEQFKLASSGALARSFSSRGKSLLVGKFGWGIAALLSYIFFVGFAIWVMKETIPANGVEFNWPLFTVRISVAIPIGLLVWFATVQFGKARRVQESYAFKGTVASSFDAYRDLIAKIIKDPELKDRPEYATFIRETIEQIYKEPPLGKDDDDNPPHTRALKDLPAILKSLGDLSRQLK